MERVIIHSITHFTIYNFRLALIKELQAKGIKVYALGKPDEYTALLEDEGVECIDSKISIDGMNPINEIKFIRHLMNISKEIDANLIHHFSPKPVLFGSIAFGLASKTKNIASITGLGHVFNLKKLHPARIITNILYKVSNFFVDKFIFLNTDDMRQLLSSGLVSKKKAKFICSEGVDLKKYNYSNCTKYSNEGKIVFSFVARLLYEKGIVEFIEAGKTLTKKYDNIEFWIIGDTAYENPSCMGKNELDEQINGYENIKYFGKVFNVEEYMCKTTIYVAPTYYREGVPRGILEAMAYKKPIITTNSVGSRHTVTNGYNGYLIEPKNSDDLIAKAEMLINSNKLNEFGENSYTKARRLFDVAKINKKTISVYQEANFDFE